MARKKTASTEPTTTAITPVETAIVPVDSGIMAIADDHTSTKLITDQEAMERLGQAVDIAVQRAEDAIPAAGINLIRCSRDFTVGRTVWAGSNYKDGFYKNSNKFTYSVDDEGFTVAHIEQDGLSSDSVQNITSSTVLGAKIGDIYTISFMVLVDDMSKLTSKDITRIQTMRSDSSATNTISINISNDNVQSGIWTKIVRHIEITDSDVVAIKLMNRLQRNGSLYFKQDAIFKGHIDNPTWSASPFDVVEKNEIKSFEYEDEKLYVYKQGRVVYAAINNHVVGEDETGAQYLNAKIPDECKPIKVFRGFDDNSNRIVFHTSGVIQTSATAGSSIMTSATWISAY